MFVYDGDRDYNRHYAQYEKGLMIEVIQYFTFF